MIESIFKTSCEIIESGWDKDRAPVDTFIMGLASSIRERNDYEEQVTLVLAPNVEKINFTLPFSWFIYIPYVSLLFYLSTKSHNLVSRLIKKSMCLLCS